MKLAGRRRPDPWEPSAIWEGIMAGACIAVVLLVLLGPWR